VLSDNDLYGWQCKIPTRAQQAFKGEDKGFLVFVDMGQGKTAPALTTVVDCMDEFLADCALVVAPIKICEAVWRQEAAKWEHLHGVKFSLIRGNPADRAFAIARRADIYLINPEHLDWLWKHLRGKFNRFQLCFIDESSLFKSPRSKRFKVVQKIRDANQDMVIVPMTGTPRPNSIMDLWTQAYMVDAGKRLGETFSAFRAKFFHTGRKLADHVYEWKPDDHAFDRIKELLADITLELSDAEKKKFPIVPKDHMLELSADIRHKYDELEEKLFFEWEGTTVIPKHGGAKSIMLRQIAAGAMYKNRLLNTDFDELHRVKLDYLTELLEELNRPCLITVEFKHDIMRLEKLLGSDCQTFRRGNTEAVMASFTKGNFPYLLMHPASAGFGLDGLQDTANHVIFFNEIWSQQNHDQLIARLARTGQKESQVFTHYLRMTDTVEVLMQIARQIKGDEQFRFRKALRQYQAEKGLL
jgi:SNF2 family DNA or RNA helicase